MKQLYLLLALLIFQTNYSQDPQLFQDEWFLYKLEIDGDQHPAPQNSEITSIPFHIEPDFFESSICTGLMAQDITISNTDIEVSFFVTLAGFPCNLQVNNDYETLYYDTFLQYNEENNIFAYTIENNGSNLLLILTNENGDKAYYGNEPLGINEINATNFSIYPNPALNEIKIVHSKFEISNLKVKIFNVEGKLLRTDVLEPQKNDKFDISMLSSGIYFMNIETDNGNRITKKFVKE